MPKTKTELFKENDQVIFVNKRDKTKPNYSHVGAVGRILKVNPEVDYYKYRVAFGAYGIWRCPPKHLEHISFVAPENTWKGWINDPTL